MATYTRQSSFSDGDTITAALFNNEFNQLVNAFNVSSGHTHDGSTAGDGGPLSTLYSNTLSFGTGADTDIAITFNANSNDGVLTWMEDEDYFKFSDDLLIDSTEKVQFRDTAIYIYSSTDGQLDLVADTEIQIAATTIDMNGAADISGNLAVGGNLTVTGNATISGNLTFGDAASDTVAFSADVASHLLPSADNTYDLGASDSEWKDLYIDGTAYLDAINFNGTAISATAAELNILDGVTATAAELNILDGVTSTAAELNILDGVTSTAAELNILDGVTSTAAELNILDGVTSSTAELNILDGVTATTAELNIMDGVTSTTAELNILDGVTASATDINLIDGITNGTVIASKAIITDANKDITGGRNITISGELDAATLDISGDADIDGTLETDALSINGTAVTSTAAELNILDGVTSTAAELNILDGVTATAAELNILDGVTSTAAELNILDGVTSTAAELNILDGKAFLDEDDMSSNSATGIASQQSIKAYVDSQVTAQDLDATTDSGTIAIDLDSETLTIAGGEGIDTSASGNTITIAGELATETNAGVATFDGTDFTVSSGDVTINAERIQDIAGAMVSSNTESGITVTYQDGDNNIDFAVDAAQTGITSLLATDIKIGEDDQTKIDFETADEIHFYAANAEQVYVADGIFGPQTDSDVDLGSSAVRWKDAYVDSLTTTGNLSVGGNLTINGTTTTVNSTTVTIDDPIFTLGGDSAPGSDDNKDRGIEFRWHNGSAAKVGFFGYDDSTSAFTFIPDASNSSEVFSGTAGAATFGAITGTTGTFSGVVDADAGITVDNITIDGTEIDLSSGALTIDVADDIILDAGGGDIYFNDDGTNIAVFKNSSSHFFIESSVSDKDILIRGNDGGSTITAVEFDMSDAGAAAFNNKASFGGGVAIGQSTFTGGNTLLDIHSSGSGTGANIAFANDHNTDKFYVGIAGDTTGDVIVHNAEDSDMIFATNNSERMRLLNDGNLGLGTTSPSEKLHVNGNIRVGSTDKLYFGGTTNYVSGSHGSNYLHFFTNNSERMRIDSSGRVGIGTSSPSSQLHLAGSGGAFTKFERADTTINNNDDIGAIDFAHTDSDDSGVAATILCSGDGTGGQARLSFYTGTPTSRAERVRIDSSGNVGIGTTSPSAPFVVSNGGAAGMEFHPEIATDTNRLTNYDRDASAYMNFRLNALTHQFYSSASESMRIDSSGNVGIGTTSPSYPLHVDGTINGVGISSNITNFSQSILISNDAGTGTLDAASNNTGLGFEVFDDLTSGDNNTAVGCKALDVLTTGSQNTALGDTSLSSLTTGDANTALGYRAMLNSGTGVSNNVAVGRDTLYNTTGSNNVAVGNFALDANTTGADNVAIGMSALSANTTADDNTAIGHDAMLSNTTGANNVAVGSFALDANTTANDNVAIGTASLGANTTGTGNTAVGRTALAANTTADNNTAVGYQAGDAITTGDLNVAVGKSAMGANTVGDRNVAVGANSLQAYNPSTNEDGYNVAVGLNALFADTTGNQNTAVGGLAGQSITTGNGNVAVGYIALENTTTGALNVAIGQEALQKNTTASGNVAVGYQALEENTSGEANVAVGYGALDGPTTRDNNTAVGYQAASAAGISGLTAVGRGALNANTTGWNTAVGYLAGNAATTGGNSVYLGAEAGLVVTTGGSNTMVGHQAGKAATTGSDNTFIGYLAGGVGTVTGSNNTTLGSSAGKNLSTGSNNLLLGHDAGLSGSPGGPIDTESNEIVLGDENITAAHVQVDWTVASDKRDKTDVEPMPMGLDFVNKLEPVTYKWDKRSNYVEKGKDFDHIVPDGSHKEDWLDVGFLAQDVEKLESEYGYNISDKSNLTTTLSDDGNQYGLKYNKFVPMLVKAVQELSAQVEELKENSHAPKGLTDMEGYDILMSRIENLEKEK